MPLVIAVLIFIVYALAGKDSDRALSTAEAQQSFDHRKTNGTFENDMFLKHFFVDNDDISTAFSKALEETIEAGYEPCIPKKFYEDGYAKAESFKCSEEQVYQRKLIEGLVLTSNQYDSTGVKYLKSAYVDELPDEMEDIPYIPRIKDPSYDYDQQGRRACRFPEPFLKDNYDKYQRRHRVPDIAIYSGYPKNEHEWEKEYKRESASESIRKRGIGARCYYKDFGTAEVVGVMMCGIGDSYESCFLSIKSVKTGEIKHVNTDNINFKWM